MTAPLTEETSLHSSCSPQVICHITGFLLHQQINIDYQNVWSQLSLLAKKNIFELSTIGDLVL